MNEYEFERRFNELYMKKQGGCFGMIFLLIIVPLLLPPLMMVIVEVWSYIACDLEWISQTGGYCGWLRDDAIIVKWSVPTTP